MIDSHAHINPRSLPSIKLEIDKINNLEYLDYVINVGIDYGTSKYSIELSKRFDKFYSVIGIHPLYEGEISDIYDLYREYNGQKIVGIGETGLDSSLSIEKQIMNFHSSIDLANKLELPLVIHSNNTLNECINIIKEHKPEHGFIFHCFQPNLEILNEIMSMGGYISVGVPITKKNAKKSLEVIKNVDNNRLLIELDYPYMSENPMMDGKSVFKRIEELRGYNYKELESKLDQNTKRLFKKMNI